MILSVVLFLAGVIGFFETLAAPAGSGGGYSDCTSYIDRPLEYLLAGLSAAATAFGPAWGVKQIRDERAQK